MYVKPMRKFAWKSKCCNMYNVIFIYLKLLEKLFIVDNLETNVFPEFKWPPFFFF